MHGGGWQDPRTRILKKNKTSERARRLAAFLLLPSAALVPLPVVLVGFGFCLFCVRLVVVFAIALIIVPFRLAFAAALFLLHVCVVFSSFSVFVLVLVFLFLFLFCFIAVLWHCTVCGGRRGSRGEEVIQ